MSLYGLFIDVYKRQFQSCCAVLSPNPKCHLPNAPVAYPALFNISAIVYCSGRIIIPALPAATSVPGLDVYKRQMDNQIIFDVLSNAVHASRILKMSASYQDSLRSMLNRLAPMQIGKYTQLQELSLIHI